MRSSEENTFFHDINDDVVLQIGNVVVRLDLMNSKREKFAGKHNLWLRENGIRPGSCT
jgi:hypothetical protein